MELLLLQSCSARRSLPVQLDRGQLFHSYMVEPTVLELLDSSSSLCSFLSGCRAGWRLKHFFSEQHHQTELPLFDELKILLRLKLGAKRAEKLLFMYGGTAAASPVTKAAAPDLP